MGNEFFELDFRYAQPYNLASVSALGKEAYNAQKTLEEKTGRGKEFLGWLNWPQVIPEESIHQIEEAARSLRKNAQALVLVGIGGSYLGTRAVWEAFRSPFESKIPSKQAMPLYFAGHQMDAAYHQGLLDFLRDKKYAVNVVSKSGTTLEPALAFRLLWDDLSSRYSKAELKRLVYVTTDAKKGALHSLASEYALPTFTIPDDIGGRYSIFTSVGLLPLAASGVQIRKLLKGASDMRKCLVKQSFSENAALQYAAYRQSAYRAGKKVEILAVYQQNIYYVTEWWKQLFGESEGKDNLGVYPSSVILSTDLHSLGQYIQEGERIIFETVIDIEERNGPTIPHWQESKDNLNGLAGKTMHYINRAATAATLIAHQSGQSPCLCIRMKKWDEASLGALLYFFQYSCAISAYISGVNPFDQPGVETYKKNMFQLLGL